MGRIVHLFSLNHINLYVFIFPRAARPNNLNRSQTKMNSVGRMDTQNFNISLSPFKNHTIRFEEKKVNLATSRFPVVAHPWIIHSGFLFTNRQNRRFQIRIVNARKLILVELMNTYLPAQV